MKSSLLLFLVSLFIIGCKKEYIPYNEIIIGAQSYENNRKLPEPTSDYLLKVALMSDLENDVIYSYLYNDTVRAEEIRFTSNENLSFGRYIISVHKDSTSDVIDIIYKGGSIQFDLILK